MLAVGATSVRVEGSTSCPRPDQVEARLAARATPGVSGARALLTDAPGGLAIELRDAQGRVRWRRALERTASCSALAEAAAVIIASGLEELASGQEPPALGPPPPDAPRPPGPHALVPPARVITPLQRRRWDAELGASFGTAISTDQVTFGAAAELFLRPRGSGWSLHLGVRGTSLASEPLAGGQARFTRVPLGAGAAYRTALGPRALLDLGLDMLQALVIAQGKGFAPGATSFGYDPGLELGVRVAVPVGRWLPFAGLAGAGWPRPQELHVTGSSARVTIPRLEGWLRVGMAVRIP
jgi:hypothetical protein